MAIQNFTLTPQRVGIIKGRILKHAMPVIVLGTVGVNDDFKPNTSDTVKYRRWLPKGATTTQPNRFFQDATGDRSAAYANASLTSEGVTSAAETVSAQDLTVTLNQYNVLYGYTDKTFDLYEDDIPKAMTELTGERTGLIHEMVLFGVLKACSNKFYGGTGTSRATVNGVITLLQLRKIARSLNANHADTVKKMVQRIPASGMYATAPVEGGSYPVFCSTDLQADIRDLPGFIHVSRYSDPNRAVPGEFGTCEQFRFICSPELVAVQDSGAAVAGSNPPLLSTTGTSADVYQVVIGSEDAWGHVGVNIAKQGGITAMTPGQIDKADPQGQRGYVGTKFYYNAIVLNNLQMAILEVGANALTQ